MIDAPVAYIAQDIQNINVDASVWRSLALNMDGVKLAVAGYAATSSPVAPPAPPAPVPSPSPDPTPVDVPPTPDPTPTPSPVPTPTTPDPTPTPTPTPDPNPAPASSPSPTSPALTPSPTGQPGSPDSGDQNQSSASSSSDQFGVNGTDTNADGSGASGTSGDAGASDTGVGASPTTASSGSIFNTIDIPRQAATAQLDRGIGWSQDQLEGTVATSTSTKPVSKTATTTRTIRVPAKKPTDITTTIIAVEATAALGTFSALRFVVGDPVLFYPSLCILILLTSIKLYYFFQLPKTVATVSTAAPPPRDTFS